ncbi:medium chain reductase/dehydrogenase [Vibrio crassostreae 9CS106]|nr:medium chain reductase/dehydrogenase [Vibrio crassostreae 9CS106]
MKLQKINKEEYRKKMNLLLVSLVGSLALFAIVFGTILIELFGSATSITGESTGNFHLNVLGVILSVALNAFIASRVKGHDYFKEALYVWNLKQIHNQIYRKLKRIQPKAEQGDRDALTILYFYYTTQKQVYDLDNNTLTIKTVQQSLDNILEVSEKWSIELDIEAFSKDLIAKF